MGCILPPYLLKRLAQEGPEDVREAAFDTMRASERLRGSREGVAESVRALPTPGLRRIIHDARNGERLPGPVVRTEGAAPSPDPAVNEAYDSLGATYAFFDEVCRRKSIDDHGLPLDASVHYGRRYMNAFWDGRQLVFGDGDGRIFAGFTRCLDVVAHELTHGVIQYEARLVYRDQPGALNESMADVFGSLVKQYHLKQEAAEADWLIGDGLLVGFPGQALRSLEAPGTAYDNEVLGKDPQPASMDAYDPAAYPDDDGGVHVYSGIPNHAFYLAAVAFGGHAWETAGRIWYYALTDLLGSSSTFVDAALATISAADRLFKGRAARVVRDAWEAVGVKAT
jgi:Zn-dependent metalloprotease